MKTAIIAGASGLIGNQLLNYLVEHGDYSKIIVLVRRPIEQKSIKMEQVIVSYDNLILVGNKLKANDVFCCLGTTIKNAGSQEAFKKVDFNYCLNLANETYKNGSLNFYLISSLGANPNSNIFYNKVKGEIEQALKLIPFNSIFIFRPSILLGKRVEFRLGEKIMQLVLKPISFLMIGTLIRYAAIESALVAISMIKNAQKNKKGIHLICNEEMF